MSRKSARSGKHRGRSGRPSSLKKARKAEPKAHGKLLRGKVQKNPRGFAFLLPFHAEFEDAFVSAAQAQGLLDGDTVEFRLKRQGPRTSAVIERILERRTTRIVGQVRRVGQKDCVVTTQEEPFELTGDLAGVRTGDWVIAELGPLPKPGALPRVEVRESFGRSLTPEHDVPFTIARFGLQDTFSRKVMEEEKTYREWAAQEFDAVIQGSTKKPGARHARPAQERALRIDQRTLPYVTIDGEDAKDFDDAIFVRTRPSGGGFTLFVSIADVAFYVRPGTALDSEARTRATSVYFPGFCLPMLPEYLSNDLCSLRPNEPKLALTAEIDFDASGQAQGARFYPSLIQTAARLTYTQVQAYLDGKNPDQVGPLGKHLATALKLYEKLNRLREKRGVLDFDLPESKIEVDPRGRPVTVVRAPRYTAHKIIEEFMIAANRAVARHLRLLKAFALYRVHEQPDGSKLEELNSLLRALGLSITVTDVSPQAFARVLEATAGIPAAFTVHQSVLRLQKQARYMPEPKGHFGLALADYAHFTSPIRRYPDLVVHRAVKDTLGLKAGRKMTDKHSEESLADDFVRLGEHTSERERRAIDAERFIVKRKQCWYFLDRVGDVFSGRVGGITKNGLFVELGEMAAEGFLPMEFLDGFYQYDERRLCLRKRPGPGTLSLGDRLEVQVVEVKVDENQITLGMAPK